MAPEVLGTSGGADAPAVVAFRAPLENVNSRKRVRGRELMDRSQLTENLMGANQDRSSRFVWPEVLRASGGADAPAVVALRASLENLNSWKGEGNGSFSTHKEAIGCRPRPLIMIRGAGGSPRLWWR